MSDLIRRANVLIALHESGLCYDNWLEVRNEINAIPSAEAVEVVRCKDCKYTETDGTEQPAIYCEKWDRWEMPEDFFCAYGYRKGGDAE